MNGKKTIRRMQRNHDRAKKQPPFNIVSLMDIFTILVFFLLVNTKPRMTLITMLDQEWADLILKELNSLKIISANDRSHRDQCEGG